MSNCRPVSLLTAFSKVLENVVHNRISHRMKADNILVPEQCYSKIILYYILKFLNQKMHVGGIFCDLAKAFDCVNHEMLLTKLHYFDMKG
jgi:hypothetical protein